MAKRKRKTLTPVDWERLPDDELLKLRVRDLDLRIEDSRLAAMVGRLYAELDARRIGLHPRCYLADEWLTPDKVPIIGIPFYLAHPRLVQLERKMLLEVEGGTEAWCMQLLRHEAGHALNYAYFLYKRTRWRELFGPFSAKYSDSYYARPYSKRYVVHLAYNYAQAHPDEDFAETFAVWLTPGSNWQQRYRGSPAVGKLRYVDHVMSRIGDRAPLVTARDTYWSAARMTSTLEAYYRRKRRYLGEDCPGFHDPGLRRVFADPDAAAPGATASRFLRTWRRQIVDSVATWTGERKFDVDTLLRRLIKRCDAMGLSVRKPDAEMLSDVTAFVTAAMVKIHTFVAAEEK